MASNAGCDIDQVQQVVDVTTDQVPAQQTVSLNALTPAQWQVLQYNQMQTLASAVAKLSSTMSDMNKSGDTQPTPGCSREKTHKGASKTVPSTGKAPKPHAHNHNMSDSGSETDGYSDEDCSDHGSGSDEESVVSLDI